MLLRIGYTASVCGFTAHNDLLIWYMYISVEGNPKISDLIYPIKVCMKGFY
jgi:hypothetical protein